MNKSIHKNSEVMTALCKRFNVKRLEIFGEGVHSDEKEYEEEIGFVVDFYDAGESWGGVESYYGLKRALEAVLRPDVVVSSSTTSMLPSAIQDGAARPQRVLVGHPFNPPHLIPLVEVAGGKLTARETLDWTVDFYRAIGKVPVLMKKEAVGHLANRLTAALFREAVHLVAEGYTTVEDIDEVVTSGPGLRWALQGPFTTYHLAGGRGGIAHYMRHIGPTQQDRWQSLGNPRLDDEIAALIVRSVEAMLADTSPAQLASLRDEGLLQLLRPKSGKQS